MTMTDNLTQVPLTGLADIALTGLAVTTEPAPPGAAFHVAVVKPDHKRPIHAFETRTVEMQGDPPGMWRGAVLVLDDRDDLLVAMWTDGKWPLTDHSDKAAVAARALLGHALKAARRLGGRGNAKMLAQHAAQVAAPPACAWIKAPAPRQ